MMRLPCATLLGVLLAVACGRGEQAPEPAAAPQKAASTPYDDAQIGRASCRERVYVLV